MSDLEAKNDQNSISAGAPPHNQLGRLQRPQTPSWIEGCLREGMGGKKKGCEGKEGTLFPFWNRKYATANVALILTVKSSAHENIKFVAYSVRPWESFTSHCNTTQTIQILLVYFRRFRFSSGANFGK